MTTPFVNRFKARLRAYSAAHQSVGCKITHLIGIPLIVLSIIWLLIDWRIAIVLFIVAWILQFIGHYVFEHNDPLIISTARSPMTLLAALTFIAKEWLEVLSGHGLKRKEQAAMDNTTADATKPKP